MSNQEQRVFQRELAEEKAVDHDTNADNEQEDGNLVNAMHDFEVG